MWDQLKKAISESELAKSWQQTGIADAFKKDGLSGALKSSLDTGQRFARIQLLVQRLCSGKKDSAIDAAKDAAHLEPRDFSALRRSLRQQIGAIQLQLGEEPEGEEGTWSSKLMVAAVQTNQLKKTPAARERFRKRMSARLDFMRRVQAMVIQFRRQAAQGKVPGIKQQAANKSKLDAGKRPVAAAGSQRPHTQQQPQDLTSSDQQQAAMRHQNPRKRQGRSPQQHSQPARSPTEFAPEDLELSLDGGAHTQQHPHSEEYELSLDDDEPIAESHQEDEAIDDLHINAKDDGNEENDDEELNEIALDDESESESTQADDCTAAEIDSLEANEEVSLVEVDTESESDFGIDAELELSLDNDAAEELQPLDPSAALDGSSEYEQGEAFSDDEDFDSLADSWSSELDSCLEAHAGDLEGIGLDADPLLTPMDDGFDNQLAEEQYQAFLEEDQMLAGQGLEEIELHNLEDDFLSDYAMDFLL